MNGPRIPAVGSRWQCETGTRVVLDVKRSQGGLGADIKWQWDGQHPKPRTCWITTWNDWVAKARATEVKA